LHRTEIVSGCGYDSASQLGASCHDCVIIRTVTPTSIVIRFALT
jgi:hypothetical protein